MTNVVPTTISGKPSAVRWGGTLFAMIFPTVVTLVYFRWASQFSPSFQQTTYSIAKTLQFVFPVAWVWLVLREAVRPTWPRRDGIVLGLIFGLATGVAAWLVYRHWLCGTTAFQDAAEQIREKVLGFGLDAAWKYAAMGVFYSLFHSLLEEYYWRWFVFGQLRQLVRPWPAILVSSLAFMAHHVVVLDKFFHGETALIALLSLGVAVGGVFWAWLYQRSRSLYGPWLSHLLVDAAIFWIGYQLVR